jgi:methionine synthase II (cobalamin-independent)
LHISKKSSTFAAAKVKITTKTDKYMIATPVRERGASYEPIIGNHENEVYYTHEEFMNELAKQLGQAYGLKDIREAN